jgi:nicotinamidase-related amidase
MSDQPRSLLSFAGAPMHPGAADRACLVVIDAQLEYLTGALPLAGVEAAAGEVRALLVLARRHAVPVFHVVHRGAPGGGLFDPDGPSYAIIPGLSPENAEPVIAKTLPNAFARTDLHARLLATGRPEIILAGFMTHMCVSTTARAALDLGIRATIVAAATATRALPDPSGGVLPAELVQRAALAALADRFAIVVRDTGALAGAWT